ncbi:hypothetical protein [Apilactobacillus ozensis]|uniref:hypothetical protein n=1 Tax=Apilactobacillus ozensis TaxID=866801 RepID=UPI000A5B5DF1|nr:hypothetical protein [Apilactobacillus ozensis]
MEIDVPSQLSLDKCGAIEVKTTSTIIYPSAGYRQTANDQLLINTTVPPMPKWLKRLITKSIETKARQPASPTTDDNINVKAHSWLLKLTDMYIHGIKQGQRNTQMVQILGKLFFYRCRSNISMEMVQPH